MNTTKKVFLILVLILVSACMEGRAQEAQKVQVIARITLNKDQIGPVAQGENGFFPLRLKEKSLEKVIRELSPRDEVILEGQVLNESRQINDSITIEQVFMVEKITPVSLSRLGKMDDFKVEEKAINFSVERPYAPKGFGVSGGFVAGITLTASILLLKALVSSPTDPTTSNQINTALIFSAGALATGLMAIEDLKSSEVRSR